MRRLLPTAAIMAALTLIAPGAALAGHGHRHHHHKRHHAKVRFLHLGPASTSGAGSTGTNPPSAPTTPANENAGKVASYTGGVLTLTLADGSSVSGKVTNQTRIECVSANPTPPTSPANGQDDEGAPGDDNGLGDDRNAGDPNQGSPPPAGQPQGDHGWSGGDGQDDDSNSPSGEPEPPCDSSALVAGAIVREAELRIGPGGTEFESIELVR